MAGYSKTPLAKKLGYKAGYNVLVLNAPKHYWNLFEELPEQMKIQTFSSGRWVPKGKGPYDLIHIFCQSEKAFVKKIHDLRLVIAPTGSLWVSWPKGASEIKTDLNRDFIRDYILRNVGLVDCKVAAIDEDWSGLKFMVRKVDR